jgi:hypothetical protein
MLPLIKKVMSNQTSKDFLNERSSKNRNKYNRMKISSTDIILIDFYKNILKISFAIYNQNEHTLILFMMIVRAKIALVF